ncbi:MAG: hypothetical protein EOP11_04610 [Proteobacteria bacterium]|nr:MAG: hypothetical protein EOP11_04610 [Pseudomonadota bacterium]
MPREIYPNQMPFEETNRFPHHRTLSLAEPLSPLAKIAQPDAALAGPARYFVRLQAITPSAARADDLFPEDLIAPHAEKLTAAAS